MAGSASLTKLYKNSAAALVQPTEILMSLFWGTVYENNVGHFVGSLAHHIILMCRQSWCVPMQNNNVSQFGLQTCNHLWGFGRATSWALKIFWMCVLANTPGCQCTLPFQNRKSPLIKLTCLLSYSLLVAQTNPDNMIISAAEVKNYILIKYPEESLEDNDVSRCFCDDPGRMVPSLRPRPCLKAQLVKGKTFHFTSYL